MSTPEGSTVTFGRSPSGVRRVALAAFARKLQAEVARGRAFDCLIAGDAVLRRLNREFRGEDCATDVLSFPSRPAARGPMRAGSYRAATVRERRRDAPFQPDAGVPFPRLGDIAISLTRARAQAQKHGHSTEDEVRILMLHGVLHLAGMDHETDNGRMAKAEKRWRARLGLPTGLIERVRP